MSVNADGIALRCGARAVIANHNAGKTFYCALDAKHEGICLPALFTKFGKPTVEGLALQGLMLQGLEKPQVWICSKCARPEIAHQLNNNQTFATCTLIPLNSEYFTWKLAGKTFTLTQYKRALNEARDASSEVAAKKVEEVARAARKKIEEIERVARNAKHAESQLRDMAERNRKWHAEADLRRKSALASLGGYLGIERPYTSSGAIIDGYINVAPEKG